MSSRITEQTKKWLVEALFELMQHKKFTQISVKEICSQAELSRKTFYRKFKSKNDILDYYFNTKISEYTCYIEKKSPQDFYDLINVFFAFWEKEQSELKILQKNNLLIQMLYKFNSQGLNLYQSINLPWHIHNGEKEDEKKQINLILLFSIGGFWNIISNQLETSGSLSASKISSDVSDALNKLFNK